MIVRGLRVSRQTAHRGGSSKNGKDLQEAEAERDAAQRQVRLLLAAHKGLHVVADGCSSTEDSMHQKELRLVVNGCNISLFGCRV